MDLIWRHPPVVTYPDWPPSSDEVPLWRSYQHVSAHPFDFSTVSRGLVGGDWKELPEITLVESQAFDKDYGMFVYPGYKGQLTYDHTCNVDFVWRAFRVPHHGETPTYRRTDDGSFWVHRDLFEEEDFWWQYGIPCIPIEGSEAALSKLTAVGVQGELTTHIIDYHLSLIHI